MFNFAGISWQREMPSSVFANTAFEIKYTLTNSKNITDCFAVHVADSATYHECIAPSIAPQKNKQWFKEAKIRKRGVYDTFPVHISSSFPFGFFIKEKSIHVQSRITVIPQPKIPTLLEDILDLEGPYGQYSSSNICLEPLGDFKGLREFRHGDPVNLIHWPSMAKTGKIMLKEIDPLNPERFSLFFHSYFPKVSIASPKSFETSLQILSGMFLYCYRNAIPFDFTAPFTGWESIAVDNLQEDIYDVFNLLATAEENRVKDINPLLINLNQVPSSSKIFIISNSPLQNWQDLLPAEKGNVTCIDNSQKRTVASELVPL